jgi:uroporphyrinogen-III decarboxylase
MAKRAEEQYKERLDRIEDAIRLKVPDRVPVLASFRYFPARYVGMTYEDVYYQPERWMEANKKAILDFQPDMYYPPFTESGKAYEILELRQTKWPGHGIPATVTHQFVEDEYMKSDEYDAFLDDMSNFAIRTYLPRISEAMKPLKDLPSLESLLFGYHGLSRLAVTLAKPEVQKALDALRKAGREIEQTFAVVSSFDEQMARLGFPAIGRNAIAAFDVISDFHRGMRGSMLDMFRRPDQLLRAIEKFEPIIIKRALEAHEDNKNPLIFIPLHRGADGFMSDEQFRTFYWPSLKRLMLALIDKGLTPCPFFEGNVDSRLEYLLELPKGKVLARFDTTDMFRAKEILGDHVCLCGNMPVSVLQVGTPDEIKSYCKKLIDVVGKDGGFIMCTRSVLDEAKPENVKIWIDFTKEYGVYR